MAERAPQSLIAEINQTLMRLKSQTHYERLGVPENTDPRTISRAYNQFAAKWHPDRYSRYDMGEDQAALQELFALFNESHTILSNSAKREEYDAALKLGGGIEGKPIDPIAVFEADRIFRLGQQLLDAGKVTAALEKFKEASSLNPDSGSFKAYHIYADYQRMDRDKNGVPTNKRKALALKEQLIEACESVEKFDMGHVFQGMILKDEGDDKGARREFMKARAMNSKNVYASRQLRLMNMRADQRSGLMGKIKAFFRIKD